MRLPIILILLFVLRSSLPAAMPADSLKKRKLIFGVSTAAAAAGSLAYLNQAWYKPHSSGQFTLFPDGNEWLQMDKAGHVWTTYQTGRLMMQSMGWAGFSEEQRQLIGGFSGLAYMTLIEVMDGFSSGYGFSWSDMGANFAGSYLAFVQEHHWREQRVQIKFSFHPTDFPQHRPELLGSGFSEQILKDYNGQTYWLSLNIASFLKKETRFPRWINLAFGYGASDMISGSDNYFVTGTDGAVIGKDRYRRGFFSLDIDLSKLPVRSRFLKTVFSALNCVKIPFPALEFNRNGLRGQALYF